VSRGDICGRLNGPKEWFGEPASAPKPPADHTDSLAHIGGGPCDDLYQADPLRRSSMKYDMAFEAEKGHGNCTGSFPDHWGA
jgi:hypothetical protein